MAIKLYEFYRFREEEEGRQLILDLARGDYGDTVGVQHYRVSAWENGQGITQAGLAKLAVASLLWIRGAKMCGMQTM